MNNEKQVKPYLKCRFCRVFNKRDYNPCTTFFFKKGLLCRYNTVESIWKWFVRCIILGIPILLLRWYYLSGISYLYVLCSSTNLPTLQVFKATVAVAITAVIPIIGIISFIGIFVKLHDSFVDTHDGKYFGKERRNYKIKETNE